MEDRFDPANSKDDHEPGSSRDGSGYSDSAASRGDLSMDDDLMDAIGIDLEMDVSAPVDDGMMDSGPGVMEEPFGMGGLDVDLDDDMDAIAALDPYTIGANVAALVRQLVSQKIDRIITVAVEQAVAKELKRIKGKSL